jgi:hypothetical protein
MFTVYFALGIVMESPQPTIGGEDLECIARPVRGTPKMQLRIKNREVLMSSDESKRSTNNYELRI